MTSDSCTWPSGHIRAVGGPIPDALRVKALLEAMIDCGIAPEYWGTQERAVKLAFDVDAVADAWTGRSPAAFLRRKTSPAYDAILDTNAGSFAEVDMHSGFGTPDLESLFVLAERWSAAGRFHVMVCGPRPNHRRDEAGRPVIEVASDRTRVGLVHTLHLAPSNYVMEGPTGLAARTFFGPHLVSQIGPDLLRSIPGTISRPCGEGIIIDLAERPWELSEDAMLAKLEPAMDHLAPARVFSVPNEKMTRWRKGERCRPY